jgi:hypothetical protein
MPRSHIQQRRPRKRCCGTDTLFLSSTPQAIAAHALRAKLALEVLRNPGNWARPIAAAVVTNAAVTAESTDSDLQWTVNSLWDALAGIVLEPELA